MENLEKTLERFEPKKEETKDIVEKPIYEGLRLIEDKEYQGPTSIKYWM